MIIIYASEKCIEAVAFRDGLFALGYDARILSVSDYGKGQVIPCDAVVISGARDKGAHILADHKAAGIPVIVIDYGYLRRVNGVADYETGHWQVGVGGLNKPPAFECSSDRFDALGIDVPSERGGGDIDLVLGQHSGDPSHGMTDKEMIEWGRAKCEETGGYWRPHPHSPNIMACDRVADGDYRQWLDRARCVHTVCSTGGLEAILHGVPAVADRPDRASWGDLSGLRLPDQDMIVSVLRRLAYGQWTLDEMRSGEAVRFILSNMRTWNDV